MPTYDFCCNDCDKDFEVVQRISEEKKAVCPSCKGQARQVFKAVQPMDFGFKPYYSDNLDPRPNSRVYVESLEHKKQLMKKYGLEERF